MSVGRAGPSRESTAPRARALAPQLFLKARSWLRTSWLWSWWEKYVYLVGRDPIMINSNYYVLDSCWYSVTTNQVRTRSTQHWTLS
jgi:hypothetical protein